MKKWNWRRGLLGAGAVLMALATSLQGAPAFADEGRNVVLPEGGITWEEGMTVYYKDESPQPEGDEDYTGQYVTLADALKAVYMSDPGDSTAILYCNPGSDVGELTHGHVADSLTVYGNGAYIGSGSGDFEIDMYAFDRTTGNPADSTGKVSDLEKDVALTVKSLDGSGLWGYRNTDHRVTAMFEDCQDMYEIYVIRHDEQSVDSPIGEFDLTVKDCSFDAAGNANSDVAIFTHFGGKVSIEDTEFKGINLPISLRNCTSDQQSSVIKDCEFIDCSTKDPENGFTLFLHGKTGTSSDFVLDGLTFTYTDEQKMGPEYPVKVGLGVEGWDNKATLQVSNTEVGVMVHPFGLAEAQTFKVRASDTLIGSNTDKDPIVIACVHPNPVKTDKVEPTCTKVGFEACWTCDACGKMFSDEACTVEISKPVEIPTIAHKTELQGKKDATCTAEGYTGDEVCSVCKEVVKKGEATAKLGHASEKWVSNSTDHWKVCDACEAPFAVEAHSFGDWKVTEEATAEKAGSKERACSVCGYVDEAGLPKLDKPGQKPEAKPEDKGDELPQTGDASALIQLAVAASGSAAIAAGALASRKRR